MQLPMEGTPVIGAQVPLAERHSQLAQINLKDPQNLVCCAISTDASWIACANVVETKLFAITFAEGKKVRQHLQHLTDTSLDREKQ